MSKEASEEAFKIISYQIDLEIENGFDGDVIRGCWSLTDQEIVFAEMKKEHNGYVLVEQDGMVFCVKKDTPIKANILSNIVDAPNEYSVKFYIEDGEIKHKIAEPQSA